VHEFDLILTLTGGLAAAFAGGYITQRLHLSPIVGYLAAGILVGPYTPRFVADRALAEQLAEIGVILLMFGVGLQFHVEDLLAVRRVAVPGAVVQSLVATALGALVASLAGWDLTVLAAARVEDAGHFIVSMAGTPDVADRSGWRES
jgi:CPA2 family monovalent cation:H+ antiporter-2